MQFNDFIHIYSLKKEATSNIKIYQVLSSLSLKDVGIFLGDGPFEFDMGIANLHHSWGSHWIYYTQECYFVL